MELFFFLFLFIIAISMAAIGLKYSNPWMLVIASVLSIGMGGILLTTEIISPKIIDYAITDTAVTPVYETFTATNIEIWVLGTLLLYGGMIFLLLTVYYSTFGKTHLPDMGEA